MTFKKNAFIAVPVVLLKKENKQDDNDINAKIVIKIFKAEDNYQDFKVNYGTSMFGKNKAFQI